MLMKVTDIYVLVLNGLQTFQVFGGVNLCVNVSP
jgi:hypothetical protein